MRIAPPAITNTDLVFVSPPLNETRESLEMSLQLENEASQFAIEAKANAPSMSTHDFLTFSKMCDRYVVKLRREVFRMRQEKLNPAEMRAQFHQSMKTYQGLLKDFSTQHQAYKAAKHQETTQNQDLKSRLGNTFLQSMDFAFCEAIPPAIDYDGMPPLTHPFNLSTPAPKEKPPAECLFQITRDEIDRTLCDWEILVDRLPHIQHEPYLERLALAETVLVGQLTLDKENAISPMTAYLKAMDTIGSVAETITVEFPEVG